MTKMINKTRKMSQFIIRIITSSNIKNYLIPIGLYCPPRKQFIAFNQFKDLVLHPKNYYPVQFRLVGQLLV